jgi:hypothetical protein
MSCIGHWILASTSVVVLACTSATAEFAGEELLVLEVARDSVPCVGEMTGRCIQVRSPGEEAWRIFYDPIDGFQHEPGVQYTLQVARREVVDPPADASSFTYRLVQIIARHPAAVVPATGVIQ